MEKPRNILDLSNLLELLALVKKGMSTKQKLNLTFLWFSGLQLILL